MTEDTISNLILQELKLIREEMKEEIRRLSKSIQFFHFDKTSKNVFHSNQDFSGNQQDSLHFVNNFTNHNNAVIVKPEPIPDSMKTFSKCESNFCTEQCESLSSENFESDNLTVGSQLAEIMLDANKENKLIVNEIIEQENILYETAEHKVLPRQPEIVEVKSLCHSNNHLDKLHLPSSNKNLKIIGFTCKEKDSGILLKPVDSPTLDENDSTHQVSSANMVNFSCKPIICLQPTKQSKSSDYHHHLETHADNEMHSFDESVLHNHSISTVSNIKRKLSSDVNHINQRKNNACKWYNKTFTTNHKLKAHTHIRTGKNLHKYDVCNKNFCKKSTLTSHIRTHTEERLYKCNICNKRFTREDSLVAHTRIHTGKKTFKCNICSREIKSKSGLNKHILIHTGEKPFKCNICDKAFNRNATLINHIRTHTGEKPFKCNVCDKRFSDHSNLHRHARIHTKQTF